VPVPDGSCRAGGGAASTDTGSWAAATGDDGTNCDVVVRWSRRSGAHQSCAGVAGVLVLPPGDGRREALDLDHSNDASPRASSRNCGNFSRRGCS